MLFSKNLLKKSSKSSLRFPYRSLASVVQAEKMDLKTNQFSKKRLDLMTGELPLGEVPEPLKYMRPFKTTTLSNGIRVVTEYWPSSTSALGVFIGAGSRDETEETSGSAHFLEHLHFKGTTKRSRIQIEQEVENLGAQLNAYTSREHTLYHMQVFNKDQALAMDVLSDMLTNSLYNNHQIEVERDTILQELEETNKDFLETLMENVYFNIYRNHMMGLPILGEINNINSITRDMIVEFHHNHYYGDNMVIVGTGNVKHEEIVDMAEEKFGKVAKLWPGTRRNTHKPNFNPSLLFVKDDDMVESNVGVFYKAADWKHKDYYPFLLLQRIFGPFVVESNIEHLGKIASNYENVLKLIENVPQLSKHECIYSPYSDTAIFGHYLWGDELQSREMNYFAIALGALYSDHINEFEVFRARNKLYHELFQIQTVTDILQSIGPQILYLNRRVQRSEIAERISHISAPQMKQLWKEWINDAEVSITNWGPINSISGSQNQS